MHSVIVVEAEVSGGATRLTRMAASGAFAVRRTGVRSVHLVGTAAGPIGDDDVDVTVRVGAGASLTVHGVCAAVALGGASPGVSRLHLAVEVEAGGRLVLVMPALIVTAEADVESTTRMSIDRMASADVIEQVVLGRHREPGGRWRGRTTIDVGGCPALRQVQTSTSVTDSLGATGGALATRFLHDPAQAAGPARTEGLGYAVPLAGGGTLLSAVGVDLPSALRDLGGCGPA